MQTREVDDTAAIHVRGSARGSRGGRLAQAALAIAVAVPAAAGAQDDAVPAFRKLDSMEARVQGCVTCHGQSGQGTNNGYFPRIAGKPAAYLYNQLVAFRDGSRKYPPMNYLVATLPDAYLREIAEHFAQQRPAFGAHEDANVDRPLLAHGQALATVGDAQKGVPPCMACHGAGLTGMDPGIPGLVGLRSAYIAAQLTRWRVGDRRAAEPDCMKRVATRLSESDVAAVAAWLGQQDLPNDASPGSMNLARLPFACGSQR